MKGEACRGCNTVVAANIPAVASTVSIIATAASLDSIAATDGHSSSRELVSLSDTDDCDPDLGTGRLVIDLDAAESDDIFGATSMPNASPMKHSGTAVQKTSGLVAVAGSSGICSVICSSATMNTVIDSVAFNKNCDGKSLVPTTHDNSKAQHRFLPKVALTSGGATTSPITSNCIISSRDATPDEGLKMKIKCNPSNSSSSTVRPISNPCPVTKPDITKFQHLLVSVCKPTGMPGNGPGTIATTPITVDIHSPCTGRIGSSGNSNSKSQCNKTNQKKTKTLSSVKDGARSNLLVDHNSAGEASSSSSVSSSKSTNLSLGIPLGQTVVQQPKEVIEAEPPFRDYNCLKRDRSSGDPYEFNIKTEENACLPVKKMKIEKCERSCSPFVNQTSNEPIHKKDAEVDACHVGTLTEPDCLGPCEPGTNVTLEGIVWNETENGLLVVNVTWRGKTYVGTLMDTTKHHWAPPRFAGDSPTSDLDGRAPKGRGKRGRSGVISTRNDCASDRKLRSNRNNKPNNPSSSTAPSPVRAEANCGGKRNRTDATNFDGARACKQGRSDSCMPENGNGNHLSDHELPAGGLFECPEENCNKKYKKSEGLRYHQTRSHKSSFANFVGLTGAEKVFIKEKCAKNEKSDHHTSGKAVKMEKDLDLNCSEIKVEDRNIDCDVKIEINPEFLDDHMETSPIQSAKNAGQDGTSEAVGNKKQQHTIPLETSSTKSVSIGKLEMTLDDSIKFGIVLQPTVALTPVTSGWSGTVQAPATVYQITGTSIGSSGSTASMAPSANSTQSQDTVSLPSKAQLTATTTSAAFTSISTAVTCVSKLGVAVNQLDNQEHAAKKAKQDKNKTKHGVSSLSLPLQSTVSVQLTQILNPVPTTLVVSSENTMTSTSNEVSERPRKKKRDKDRHKEHEDQVVVSGSIFPTSASESLPPDISQISTEQCISDLTRTIFDNTVTSRSSLSNAPVQAKFAPATSLSTPNLPAIQSSEIIPCSIQLAENPATSSVAVFNSEPMIQTSQANIATNETQLSSVSKVIIPVSSVIKSTSGFSTAGRGGLNPEFQIEAPTSRDSESKLMSLLDKNSFHGKPEITSSGNLDVQDTRIISSPSKKSKVLSSKAETDSNLLNLLDAPSPAYSDISDANENAPMLEKEAQPLVDDECRDTAGTKTPSKQDSYVYSPFYSQPPYLTPAVAVTSVIHDISDAVKLPVVKLPADKYDSDRSGKIESKTSESIQSKHWPSELQKPAETMPREKNKDRMQHHVLNKGSDASKPIQQLNTQPGNDYVNSQIMQQMFAQPYLGDYNFMDPNRMPPEYRMQLELMYQQQLHQQQQQQQQLQQQQQQDDNRRPPESEGHGKSKMLVDSRPGDERFKAAKFEGPLPAPPSLIPDFNRLESKEDPAGRIARSEVRQGLKEIVDVGKSMPVDLGPHPGSKAGMIDKNSEQQQRRYLQPQQPQYFDHHPHHSNKPVESGGKPSAVVAPQARDKTPHIGPVASSSAASSMKSLEDSHHRGMDPHRQHTQKLPPSNTLQASQQRNTRETSKDTFDRPTSKDDPNRGATSAQKQKAKDDGPPSALTMPVPASMSASYSQYYGHYLPPGPYPGGPIPFDPSHGALFSGMNPMTIGYSSSPYLHPQMISPGVTLPSPDGKPSRGDMGVQPPPPSPYFEGSSQIHKIHELKDVAKGPGETAGAEASPGRDSGQTKATSGTSSSAKDKEQEPQLQRHLHTHHHMHVLGPIFPYDAMLASQQVAASACPPQIPRPYLGK